MTKTIFNQPVGRKDLSSSMGGSHLFLFQYRYNENADTWYPNLGLLEPRSLAAGAMTIDNQWWITGGEGKLDTTEL